MRGAGGRHALAPKNYSNSPQPYKVIQMEVIIGKRVTCASEGEFLAKRGIIRTCVGRMVDIAGA